MTVSKKRGHARANAEVTWPPPRERDDAMSARNPATRTAFGVALSPDSGQRFLYVADASNERVAILDRTSLREIGHIGGPGRKAGEFFHIHSLGVDPQGNIITGESQGYRVQKFIFKGLSTGQASTSKR